MRRPDTFRSRDNDVDSMMTPMIDVVFLLLVFFVWTTSMQAIEYVLPSQMKAQLGNRPTENIEPPPEQDFDDVIIRISWNGTRASWTLNDVDMGSIDQVDRQLQRIATVKPDAPIIVDPEPLVPVGFVIEIYDLAKLAGFQQVSFAVEQGI